MHIIAGKAICFREAMQPAFQEYASQIIANAKALAEVLAGEFAGALDDLKRDPRVGGLLRGVGELLQKSDGDDPKDGAPAKGGEVVIALDPARFVADGDAAASFDHAEVLFGHILEQDGTRLPSDRRYAARERTPTEGIKIPQQLYDDIKSLRE